MRKCSFYQGNLRPVFAKIVKYVFAKPFTKLYEISHEMIFQGISCCAIRTNKTILMIYVPNQFKI